MFCNFKKQARMGMYQQGNQGIYQANQANQGFNQGNQGFNQGNQGFNQNGGANYVRYENDNQGQQPLMV